jgi:hypothetical protein
MLIALGLILPPLQLAQPVSAMPSMAMESDDCMKPPSCCEQVKKDCSLMLGFLQSALDLQHRQHSTNSNRQY